MPYNYNAPPPTVSSHIDLHKERIYVQKRIPQHMHLTNIEYQQEHVMDHLVHSLMATVYAENLDDIKVPETWWDHFKETYSHRFPKWFLNKYPIKYKKMEASVLYPHLEERPESLQPHILRMKYEDETYYTNNANK